MLKRMNSVGFNRICCGFNSFHLRSGLPLSICLTPEHDPPPKKHVFFPIQPLRHLFPPSYSTRAVRDDHLPSRCTRPGPGWQTATRTTAGPSTAGTPQPSLQQVCFEGLPRAAPKGDTTTGGGGWGQQSWSTVNHLTQLLQDQFNEHTLARS